MLVAHVRLRQVALWRARVVGLAGLTLGLPALSILAERSKDVSLKWLLLVVLSGVGFVLATLFVSRRDARRPILPPIDERKEPSSLPYRE